MTPGVSGLTPAELEALLLAQARSESVAGRMTDAVETVRVARVLFPDSPRPVHAAAALEARRGQGLRAQALEAIARRLSAAPVGT